MAKLSLENSDALGKRVKGCRGPRAQSLRGAEPTAGGPHGEGPRAASPAPRVTRMRPPAAFREGHGDAEAGPGPVSSLDSGAAHRLVPPPSESGTPEGAAHLGDGRFSPCTAALFWKHLRER